MGLVWAFCTTVINPKKLRKSESIMWFLMSILIKNKLTYIDKRNSLLHWSWGRKIRTSFPVPKSRLIADKYVLLRVSSVTKPLSSVPNLLTFHRLPIHWVPTGNTADTYNGLLSDSIIIDFHSCNSFVLKLRQPMNLDHFYVHSLIQADQQPYLGLKMDRLANHVCCVGGTQI